MPVPAQATPSDPRPTVTIAMTGNCQQDSPAIRLARIGKSPNPRKEETRPSKRRGVQALISLDRRPEDLIATLLAFAPHARRSPVVVEIRAATVEQKIVPDLPVD
jgi:hypothetical protein